MRLAGLISGQRRRRSSRIATVSRLSEPELRARLSGHADRLVAHRGARITSKWRFASSNFQRKAFLGKRRAIRDRISDLDRSESSR